MNRLTKTKKKKIAHTRDIPFSFNKRLYHNFSNLLASNHKKYFYTNEYYRDIALFCQENSVFLSISEYLALNFFFLSKNKDVSGSDILSKYLYREKEIYQVEFLNSNVSRAKMIIQALETQQKNEKSVALSPTIESSVNKLSDLLNIYYGYAPEEFEMLAKAKIQDFYTQHEHLIEPAEAYMTSFLKFESHIFSNDSLFKTEKFQKLLDPFVKTNIAALIHHHKEETQVFKKYKHTLN